MKSITDNLMDFAEYVVEFGKKNGAGEIQVAISDSTNFSVDVQDGEVEKLTQAGSRELNLKVIVDSKTAVASSSDFSKDTLKNLILNAIERAKLSSADEFAGLPEKQELKLKAEQLDIFDPAIAEIHPKKKIEIAQQLERIALSDNRIGKSSGAFFGNYSGQIFFAGSNGFSGSYNRTSCSCGVSLQAGAGVAMYEDGWYNSSTFYSELMPVEKIAAKAVENTTRMAGARKIPSQNVPVIFEPKMTSRILSFLSQCLSGRAVYLSQSFLAGKLNEKIAHKDLTIIDDGTMPRALGSRLFDAEGSPAARKLIIKNGILQNYLLDHYSAKKLSMKTTGNAGGPQNFYIEAGEKTADSIIRSTAKGLLLVKTLGQGTVPTTGDISTGAFGLWIENGQIAYPVAEITISGNLGTMLKNITAIGDDLVFDSTHPGPTIKFAEMTISGT